MEEINKIKSGFDVINNTIDDYCDYYKKPKFYNNEDFIINEYGDEILIKDDFETTPTPKVKTLSRRHLISMR